MYANYDWKCFSVDKLYWNGGGWSMAHDQYFKMLTMPTHHLYFNSHDMNENFL